MKSILFVISTITTVLLLTPFATAEIIGGQNWADAVEDYTATIQNYGATMMDTSTTWWLTGDPDATSTSVSMIDDYVAGWRGGTSEYVIMKWDTPLADVPGDDLMIRLFSGGKTVAGDVFANVFASVDGTSYVNIGTLGKGTPLVFREETFDFAGQFSGGVSYVKVERVALGSGTGLFFDAFGSVPEPGSMMLLLIGIGSLAMYRRRSCG